MRHPDIVRLSPQWLQSLSQCSTEIEPGKWVPARPLAFMSVGQRVKATWLVWTGRADALIWPGQ